MSDKQPRYQTYKHPAGGWGAAFDFADEAANDMIHRTPYIEAVLGEEAAQEAQLEADQLESWGINGSDGAGSTQGPEGGDN